VTRRRGERGWDPAAGPPPADWGRGLPEGRTINVVEYGQASRTGFRLVGAHYMMAMEMDNERSDQP